MLFRSLLLELQAALLLMAILEFLAVVIAQGSYEAVKHLFLFDALVDVCFAIGATWLAGSIVIRRRRRAIMIQDNASYL